MGVVALNFSRWPRYNSRGFEILRHAEGNMAVEVSADVDTNVGTVYSIIAVMERGALREIQARYGIGYSFEGRSADQRETIAGLTPLLFEKSFQAQFLIPMATSIAFDLGFATSLVLLVIPSLLSMLESVQGIVARWTGGIHQALKKSQTCPREVDN